MSGGDCFGPVILTVIVMAASTFTLAAVREHNLLDRWREQAVEHGCGGYDRQTGDWTWGAQ